MTSPTPVVLTHTVNLDATTHNMRTVKAIAGVSESTAVVRADGYSQGTLRAMRAALDGGVTQLGVATIDEAFSARKGLRITPGSGHTIPILAWIWNVVATSLMQHTVAVNIDLGLLSMAYAPTVASIGRALSVTPHVTVMVDMSLGCSGFSMTNGDFEHAIAQLAELHKTGVLNITGAFTHFACTDEPGNESVNKQAQNFRATIAALRETGLDELINHAASSPASLSRPDLAFDMARLDLAIHDGELIVRPTHGLRPAMWWEASVILVKELPTGQSVSYGQTWTADHDTTTDIVPCDYAGGMACSAFGHFEISINGTRYLQVGRTCVDQFVVDLGPDTDVEIGDTTVIVDDPTLGEPGLNDLTKALGTINYEVLTASKGRNE